MYRIVLSVIICLSSLNLFAQELHSVKYENEELSVVLTDIEAKTGIIFSFSQELVAQKKVTMVFDAINIDELLNEIANKTGLSFERISDRQIVITQNMEVCGRILDAQSKAPLVLASVWINPEKGTTTDSEGYFSLQSDTGDQTSVNVRYVGYGDQIIEISPGMPCQNHYLNPDAEALDEVIILGYVTTGIDRNKDGSVAVSSEKLGILPGLVNPDIAQSIQLVPGITSLDESATGIQVRGGAPDQNLVYLDNIKLYNTGYFYGMFSAFNPYATQNAKIFKSGASPAYGDRVSGVIDISTGNKIPEQTTGGLGLDGLSLDGYVRTPVSDKVAVYLFARRTYADVWKSPTYDGYATKIFKNSGVVRKGNGEEIIVVNDDEFDINSSDNSFYFHDINAKVVFKPSNTDEFSISSLFTRNRLDFSFLNGGELRVDDLVTTNKGLSFEWKRFSSEKWGHSLKAYYSKYRSDYLNVEILGDILEESNTRNNEITDIGIDYGWTYYFPTGNTLTMGYQYSKADVFAHIAKSEPLEPENLEDNFVTISDESNTYNAFYGEYKYAFTNTGLLSLGLRAVKYSLLNQFYLEPRLNLEYPLSDKLRFKASAERRYQSISQLVEFDQTELRLENNLWVLSDGEEFPMLGSIQYSSGLLFDYNGWTIDTDAYLKKITGLTSYTNGFSNPLIELSEGESDILGIDILLKKEIEGYRVWAGYTFNDINYQFSTLQSNEFPGNNDITHNFRISNTYQLNKWQFSLGWSYRTGEPVTPISTFDEATAVVSFGKVNSRRLENFHRLDASVIYDFTFSKNDSWRGRVGLSVLNLYNRKIPLSMTYRAEDEGSGLQLEQVVQRHSLGITPNAVLRLFF